MMLELREFELQDKFASLSKRAKSRAERFHTAILGDVVLEDLILTDLLGRGGGGTLVHACIVKGTRNALTSFIAMLLVSASEPASERVPGENLTCWWAHTHTHA